MMSRLAWHLQRRTAPAFLACALASACTVAKPVESPFSSFAWSTEIGNSEVSREGLPPEADAIKHFVAAQIAANDGDDETAIRELEKAVAANPDPGPPTVGYVVAALALTVLPLLVTVTLGVVTLVLLFRWVTG